MYGNLEIVSRPTIEPVALSLAKLHLKVDGTEDDQIISGLIASARRYAEGYMRRAILTQTWDYWLDAFPGTYIAAGNSNVDSDTYPDPIRLPMPPLQSVTFVKYLDTSGVIQTWDSASYNVAGTGLEFGGGRIVPAYGVYYPSTRLQPDAVQVRFIAGYPDLSPPTVPDEIIQGILLVIGHWYVNRGAVTMQGLQAAEVPMSAKALFDSYSHLEIC